MFLLSRTETDPFFNLAAEEYFLKHGPGEMVMLWQNEPSVVIGKHQNPYTEVNYPYTKAHGISIVRRISGGGAVYHDLGNLNFTFIQKTEGENKVNFRRFTEPILTILNKLGIKAEAGKRNDLTLNGLKFSGNAQHIFRDKVIHHGTLLFSADLQAMNESLQPRDNRIVTKALPSVRSKVCNLKEFCTIAGNTEQFRQLVEEGLQEMIPGIIQFKISDTDRNNIEALARTRYSQWDWNFGYSPAYILKVAAFELPLKIEVRVQDGIITTVENVSGQQINQALISIFEKLPGTRHKEEDLEQFYWLHESTLSEAFNRKQFADLFF